MSKLIGQSAHFVGAVPAATGRMQAAKREGLAPGANRLASILKMAGLPERFKKAVLDTVGTVSASADKVADHIQHFANQATREVTKIPPTAYKTPSPVATTKTLPFNPRPGF